MKYVLLLFLLILSLDTSAMKRENSHEDEPKTKRECLIEQSFDDLIQIIPNMTSCISHCHTAEPNFSQHQKNLTKNGYTVGDPREGADIFLREKIEEAYPIIKKLAKTGGKGKGFHKFRNMLSVILENNQVFTISGSIDMESINNFYKSDLFISIEAKLQLLGYSKNSLFIRFSSYDAASLDKGFKAEIGRRHETKTNVHRDYWDGTEISFLIFIVIYQENLRSDMRIMESKREILFDECSTDSDDWLDGTKLLWAANGVTGLTYMIDQKNFPEIYHYVGVIGDTKAFERTTLTIGVIDSK